MDFLYLKKSKKFKFFYENVSDSYLELFSSFINKKILKKVVNDFYLAIKSKLKQE